MFRQTTLLTVALVAFGFTASISSAEETASQNITWFDPEKMTLQPLPKFPGVANGFLIGAFDQAGLYAAVGEMAAGSTFPSHTHPDTRLTVVISGTMYLGEGEITDPAGLVAYPAGTTIITPANIPHYMAALDGDVRVLEIGAGPSGFVFIEGAGQ